MKKQPQRPYINRVSSNIKCTDGTDDWSMELGQHTLIVGGNASGKTGVIQAVELATTAVADDVVGRLGVRDPALLLYMVRGDKLTASCETSRSTGWDYSIEREGNTVKKPEHISRSLADDASVTFPLRAVKEALAGSSTTARTAFLTWAAASTTDDDVLSYIPTNLHERYRTVTGNIAPNDTPVDRLVKLAKYAGKRARDAAKEVKGAETILAEADSSLPARPTDQDIAKAEAAVAEAQRAFDNVTQPQDPEEVPAPTTGMPANVPHSLEAIRWAMDNGLEQCPTCGSEVGFTHLEVCHDYFARMLDETVDADLVPEPANTVDVDAIKNQLFAAHQALSALMAARSRWDGLTSARDKAAGMQSEVDDYKAIKKACETAIGQLLGDLTSSFCVRVGLYLPVDWTFDIELKDGKRDVFRMGLRDVPDNGTPGYLRCALSGAEWAAVTTAVAMAASEGLPINEPVIIVPEDRAWDTTTLGQVMRAFTNFDGQVIMASTVRPKGRPPKNWTIIDLDKTQPDKPKGEKKEEVAPVKAADVHYKTSATPVPAPPAPETVRRRPADEVKPVTPRGVRMLNGLGFDSDTVARMTAESSADIIKNGITADMVLVRDDGSYEYRSDKLVKLPRAR